MIKGAIAESASARRIEGRMTLLKEAQSRVELARRIGREPLYWRANAALVGTLAYQEGRLAGLPIEAATRSWPLELVCAPPTSR